MRTFCMSRRKCKHEQKDTEHGDKIAIVMESFTTNIGVAELCRKHHLSLCVFYLWKGKFLEAGKQGLLACKEKSPIDILQKENDDLKKLVDEMAFVNSTLKKNLEAGKR